MNKRGFTLIEVLVSIVLIPALIYGLSRVPIDLVQLKISINQKYDSDMSILKLKQAIDTDIIHGGIIKSNDIIDKLIIGKSIYTLKETNIPNQYLFKIKGISEDILYLSEDGFSFFYLDGNSDKKLRYLNEFSSFNVKESKTGGQYE